MIRGFTFLFADREKTRVSFEETRESLRAMRDATACDTAVLAFGALQDTPQSETVAYAGIVPSDEELKYAAAACREFGLSVTLKPMVNCRNGVWRAYIDFFDREAPCEPKWSEWFKSYTDYIVRYAAIAAEIKADMLIIGCELTLSQRKTDHWRALVEKIRAVYSGKITYNADKYQEDAVPWWDAVDYISSSGYYPIDQWDENLDRIAAVVQKFKKPFFFAECGCPSRTGSSFIPNDWTRKGYLNLEEQAAYYANMFEKAGARSWVRGFVCWAHLETYARFPIVNDDYSVLGKPACQAVKEFYSLAD
ncbi:MAG: hypothetical protein LBE74_00430 [Treponema sp.]|nr:hypothetical protein [Treponema sp.]